MSKPATSSKPATLTPCEVLVRTGVCNRDQVDAAEHVARERGIAVDDALVVTGACSSDELGHARALVKQIEGGRSGAVEAMDKILDAGFRRVGESTRRAVSAPLFRGAGEAVA